MYPIRDLRGLAAEFRARGLAEYARGRADLHAVWCEAAEMLEERIDDDEEDGDGPHVSGRRV